MNAKPGWRMPWAMMSAVPFGSPKRPATKLAPAASAITSGVERADAGAPGRESLLSQSGSVVGEAWPGHAVDVGCP